MYQTYNPTPGRVRFDWIGESWQLFLAQWGTWVLAILISGVIFLGISFAVAIPLGVLEAVRSAMAHPYTSSGTPASPPHATDPLGQIIQNIVNSVVAAFFYGGLFRMANKQVRGEMIGVGDLFSGGSTFLPMLGFMIVFNILSFFGALFFCVGILVVYAFLFPAFALIAEGVSFGDAFSRSFEGMKQDWLRASLFVLVFGLLQFATAIFTCFVALFATYPMKFLATSLACRDMIGPVSVPAGPGYYPTQGPPGAWPPSPNPYGQPSAPGQGPYGPIPPPAGSSGGQNAPGKGLAAGEPPGQTLPEPNPPGSWPPSSQ